MEAAELADLPSLPLLGAGVNKLPKGSTPVDISALKIAALGDAADVDFVLEFNANGPTTLGDGTAGTMVGLWAFSQRTGKTNLLGVLGITLQSGGFPQIPIAGAAYGFAQLVHVPAIYDRLGIGGVSNDVTPNPAASITCSISAVRQFSTQGSGG